MEVIKKMACIEKIFGIHSPSKLFTEQAAKELAEAQKELKEWAENNKEEIEEFQKQLGI